MSLFVKISDFEDIIPKDKYTQVGIQKYMDSLEEQYLIRLLGAELFDLFKADFQITGTTPTDQRFIDIWQPFHLDNNDCLFISKGIKEMLVHFISFEFLRDEIVKKNIGGLTKNEQANSQIASVYSSNLLTLHNEAVKTHETIRWFICHNSTYYKEYNGIKMKTTIG